MTQRQQRSLWFHLLDVFCNIVVIVAVVAGIRTFLVSPFQVEGNSMVGTLEHQEYIIINKLAYFLGAPERGDVVVFRPPTEPKKFFVKRVIGMPGDKVVLRDGQVYVTPAGGQTEHLLEEPYLDEANHNRTFRHPPGSGVTTPITYTVPDDTYFLLGDNRQGSLDSRSFTLANGEPAPYVPRTNIKGRVWFIALPITKIHALEPPQYPF